MVVGVDIGSRTIKVAAVKDSKLLDYKISESGFDPLRQSIGMMRQYKTERIVATGYGRHLARRHFADDIITEIKAHALGARYFFPECRLVLDVGGQDSKVIALDKTGKVLNFQMNDKCAAGTGRFLEIMASTLGYSLDEFGREALNARDTVQIGSMCTVFAESEIVSLKNQGTPPADIARAVHHSVVKRLVAMLSRVGHIEAIVFSGGVANNPCIGSLLQENMGVELYVPSPPDIVGALGAALYAEKEK